MTLAVDEFIRHFLIHVLPSGFHRIRHYGLFANAGRAENIARARQLLHVPEPHRHSGEAGGTDDGEPPSPRNPCPCCGGHLIVIETFERGLSAPLSAGATEPDRHLMTAAFQPQCPQPVQTRGWHLGRSPPRLACDHRLAMLRTRRATKMEPVSLPDAGLANNTAAILAPAPFKQPIFR
jgi:hypothetical protein